MSSSRRAVSICLRHGLVALVALSGCTVAGDPGSGTGSERELRGGGLHGSRVAAFHDPSDLDVAQLMASPALAAIVGPLQPSDFAVTTQALPTPSGMPLVYVSMQQQVDGVPILGAYLHLTLRPGDDGDARLLASSHHLFHAPPVDLETTIDRAAAIEAARPILRSSGAIARAELILRPLEGRLSLVWDVVAEEGIALVLASGPRAGRVVGLDDRIYDATGTVRGHVAVGGAPGAGGEVQLLPLPFLRVAVGLDGLAYTGLDGRFTFPEQPTSIVIAYPTGYGVSVSNFGGGTVTAIGPATEGVALNLGAADDERLLAQVTAYYYLTESWRFALANGIPLFFGPRVARVNDDDFCHASYSPTGKLLRFSRAGDGCNNTAEASLVMHEFGHVLDDYSGGITDAGLSEGWGDVLSCFARKDPIVGGHLFSDGTILRRCDNEYQYPGDSYIALGQAWSGFAWHVREGLIEALGDIEGDALARALVLPSLASNAADVEAAVREVFLRDDDDGDLSNQTPHWEILRAAADRHALGFVVEIDGGAPAAVTDLSAPAVGVSTVTLRWTAPGDDGDSGTAQHYELRYATQAMTEASFAVATPVWAGLPLPAGQLQEVTVTVPPGVATLFFALRGVDEVGNVAPLSNQIQVTPLQPKIVWSEEVEASTGGWEAGGLWHVTQRRAAGGSRSFWYGQESTGNFDTGARTAGTLSSPIIDLAGVVAPRLVLSQLVDVGFAFDDQQLRIRVRTVDEPLVGMVAEKETTSTNGTFAFRVIDLAAVAGRRVRIHLDFDSIDATGNQKEGWYVDDLRVIGDWPALPPGGVLLINEVLADPPAGYDANGDGVASSNADELVELLNIGDSDLYLAGATLADGAQTRFTFPAGTVIPPGGVLVVFGGGAPQIAAPFLVSSGLSLNNGGDTVRIRRDDGAVLAEMSYGAAGGQDASLVRQIDGDPASPYVRHVTLTTAPASPGRRSDGAPFGDEVPAPQIIVNEILADPPAGYDASGDGVASTTQDEFVELVNVGSASIDLSGATISDASSVRVTLPSGTLLDAGDVLLVFGGGGIGLSLPGVTVVSQGSLNLNNAGDSITLRSAGGTALASATYGGEGGQDASLVRATDGDATAPFVRHVTVAATPASAGRRIDGSPF